MYLYRAHAVHKLPQEMGDISAACSAVGTTTEFSPLHPDRQQKRNGSLDDIFGQETRGERPSHIAPPGRTYECEVRRNNYARIYNQINFLVQINFNNSFCIIELRFSFRSGAGKRFV